jgi:GDP-L-fucose synthase
MVGSAIVRELVKKGYQNIVARTHAELDLTNQLAVQSFFEQERPDQVYLAAAKVGGIHANNTFPAEFIYQNLMMETNVIHQAFSSGVKKLLFLGSSCIYPKLAPQPMSEDALLTGKLEPTNEPYAIAKIAGIKLCESYNRQYGQGHGIDYRSVMPTNLYGPGDNFDLQQAHVIPALMRRMQLGFRHICLPAHQDSLLHPGLSLKFVSRFLRRESICLSTHGYRGTAGSAALLLHESF